jgi:hypothetical protein
MPYALFCHEARLSKAYPTEADVWERARQSGLLVDMASWDNEATPQSVFENDYEIRPCSPDPLEDLAENQAAADWRAETEFMPCWADGDGGQVALTNAGASHPRSAAAWKRTMAMRVLFGVKAGWKRGRQRDRIDAARAAFEAV